MIEKTTEMKKNKVVELGTVTESLSSVKIYKAAGNETRYEVKAYNNDPMEAMRIARKIMNELNKKYKVKG